MRTALMIVIIVLLAGIAALLVILITRNNSTAVTSIPSPTSLGTATPAPSPSPTATTTTSATSAAATTAPCGPFTTSLPALVSGTGAAIPGASGSGCAPATAPSSPFTAPRGWTLATSYTCSGSAGAGGMGDTIDFTAHNTDTNTDLPPDVGEGPWGSGEGGADGSGATAPAGHYVIVVSLPHPEVNQCQWTFQAHAGSGG